MRNDGRNWNQYSHGPAHVLQMHTENTRAATPDEYYCQTVTIPLLDHLLLLTNRFNAHVRKPTLGLCLVQSVMRKAHDWCHHEQPG